MVISHQRCMTCFCCMKTASNVLIIRNKHFSRRENDIIDQIHVSRESSSLNGGHLKFQRHGPFKNKNNRNCLKSLSMPISLFPAAETSTKHLKSWKIDKNVLLLLCTHINHCLTGEDLMGVLYHLLSILSVLYYTTCFIATVLYCTGPCTLTLCCALINKYIKWSHMNRQQQQKTQYSN